MPHSGSIRAKAALLAGLALAWPQAGMAEDWAGSLAPNAPVERFSIYNFDQENGWRTWKLEGRSAVIGQGGAVTLSDVRLRVFEASERQSETLLIESPLATMAAGKGSIGGPSEILVIAEGFLLTGEDWTWQTKERTLLINTKAHAVLEMSLGPLLE